MKTKRTPGDANFALFHEVMQPRARVKPRNRKELGIPDGLEIDKYERDEDGMLREIVGPWVCDKHAILERYVTISAGVRKSWVARNLGGGATYIDLFSGPGRVRIKDAAKAQAGSPIVAWNSCQKGLFTDIYVADAHADLTDHCVKRLQAVNAPVRFETGPAAETVDKLIPKLNKLSYHFAFLDPFSLGTLSFDIIQKLARLKYIDILIHVSVQDMNRNLRRFIQKEGSSLDRFAPGWRAVVDTGRSDDVVRTAIFNHWKSLLKTTNMKLANAVQLVSGETNQPLYWLALAARHPKAHEFWDKILPKKPEPQVTLFPSSVS